MIMENLEVIKNTMDSYIAKHSNAEDCAKDAVELGLDSLIVVGKGVEMINNKILSTAFNAVCGAITVDDSPTTTNFRYWMVKKWKDHHINVI
jgi:dsRNA-specific ribonuclease